MNSKIYSIKNYKVKREDPKIITSESYNDILIKLNSDKGYHLLLFDDIKYKLFFDIDNVPLTGDDSIYTFFEYLSKIKEIDLTDIKYTESKKGDTLSYHIVVPCIHATLKTQSELASNMKEDNKYIDLSVYQNNRWFRLPQQTLKEKPIEHKIINGIMADFMLDWILYSKSTPYEISTDMPTKTTKPTKQTKASKIKKHMQWINN